MDADRSKRRRVSLEEDEQPLRATYVAFLPYF